MGWDTEYNLYYSLTYSLKWKFFGLETCTGPHYLVLNFYQINEDSEIWTCDCLVIKTLILYQKPISIQKLKLLNKISRYALYYSSTRIIGRKKYSSLLLPHAQTMLYLYIPFNLWLQHIAQSDFDYQPPIRFIWIHRTPS